MAGLHLLSRWRKRDTEMLKALDPATDYVVVFRAEDGKEGNPKTSFVSNEARRLGLKLFSFSVETSKEEPQTGRLKPAKPKRPRRRWARAGLAMFASVLEAL